MANVQHERVCWILGITSTVLNIICFIIEPYANDWVYWMLTAGMVVNTTILIGYMSFVLCKIRAVIA